MAATEKRERNKRNMKKKGFGGLKSFGLREKEREVVISLKERREKTSIKSIHAVTASQAFLYIFPPSQCEQSSDEIFFFIILPPGRKAKKNEAAFPPLMDARRKE